MRTVFFLALATAGVAMVAHASTISTGASVSIAEPGGIQVLNNVVTPAIIAAAVSVPGGNVSSASSSASTGTTSGNSSQRSKAELTIRAQTGDTLSMAVPESFQVIRSGSTEGLTVKTTTDTDLHLSKGGVVFGGSEIDDGTMSVNVGGFVTLASNVPTPGPYEGTLLVLVQYN